MTMAWLKEETGMADTYVLDRELILERLGGDEEMLWVMLDVYVQDVENNCNSLETAFASGDAEALLREAHTVKGLLATFSDDFGANEAFAIEQQAKGGHVADQAGAVRALQARMRMVSQVLRGELDRR